MERTKAATVKLQYLKKYLCCHKKDKQNQAPYQKLSLTFMLWYCVQYPFFFLWDFLCSLEYFWFAEWIKEILLTSLRCRTENRHGIFSIRNWCRMTCCGDFLGSTSIFWLYKKSKNFNGYEFNLNKNDCCIIGFPMSS